MDISLAQVSYCFSVLRDILVGKNILQLGVERKFSYVHCDKKQKEVLLWSKELSEQKQ